MIPRLLSVRKVRSFAGYSARHTRRHLARPGLLPSREVLASYTTLLEVELNVCKAVWLA